MASSFYSTWAALLEFIVLPVLLNVLLLLGFLLCIVAPRAFCSLTFIIYHPLLYELPGISEIPFTFKCHLKNSKHLWWKSLFLFLGEYWRSILVYNFSIWEFYICIQCILILFIFHSSPWLFPDPPLTCFQLSFLSPAPPHQAQFMLPIYLWVWGHSLKCGWPTSAMPLKKTDCLSPQNL